MRNVFFCLFLLLGILTYAQESGIVISDNVRVRSSPNATGQIIAKLQINDKVTLFSATGSGNLSNGIWDYWYKISETKDEWINAYFIGILPIYFNANTYGGKNYKLIDVTKSSKECEFKYIIDNNKNMQITKDFNFKIQDNPLIRLSNFMKYYSNNQVSYGLDEPEQKHPMLYGIYINKTTYKEIIELFGNPTGGNGRGAFYYELDIDGKKNSISFMTEIDGDEESSENSTASQEIYYFSSKN